MYNIKSLSIFLFSFAFLLNSCKNEENILTPTQQKQLSKIVQDANNYSSFYYSNGRLSKYESYSSSQLTTSVNLYYEDKVKPQSENYISMKEDYMKYYHYNLNSVLDSMTFSWKDSTGSYIPTGYVKYYYNGGGQIIKTEQFTNSNLLVVKFEYSCDANGNIINEKQFNSNQLVYEASMTYDDKVNPWYSLKDYLLYNVTINKNNLLSRNQIYYNSQESYQTTTSYIYDSDDYPISSQIKYYSNNDSTIINQTYEYK